MNFSIRRWKPSDSSILVNYLNNVHIWSKLTDDTPLPFTESDAKNYILPEDSKLEQVYAVECDGTIIGGVKFTCCNAPNNIVYRMNFWLDPEFWDNDEVVKILKDMIRFCFFHLPAIKLLVLVIDNDTEYQKALVEAGFLKEAVLKKSILKSGSVEDLHIFSITE